jgi:hypothetical protein
MLSRRADLRYLILAIFVVLLGLFNSGLDEELLDRNTRPQTTVLTQPLVDLGYHYRKQTREERFYQCFGEMALGRQHDRAFLLKHRGDLGEYQTAMVGPESVTGPLLPYRDYIAEYPPVNFPFIATPSLAGEKSDTYAIVFRLMLAFLLGCALFLSTHLAGHLFRSEGVVRRFLLLSLTGALLLGPIMVTRLDSIALVCFVGALVAVCKERPIGAGVLLALATGAKIVPMFLIPFFFLHWWMNGERGKSLRFSMASVGSLAVIFLPPALIGTDNFRALFQFHGERPIQVESTYAVLLRLQEMLFGVPVEPIHSFGSWNLGGAYATLFGSASKFLALGAVAAVLWLYRGWLAGSPKADPVTRVWWLLRASAATIAGLMFFSKVLSPQYLIWMWPWIFLAERPKQRLYPILCLSAFFLTQLITHTYATSMVEGEVFGTLLLATRNACLFAFLAWLARFPGHLETPEPIEYTDYGNKTAMLPVVLALTALIVRHQCQSIESAWLAARPRPLTPLSYRLEFSNQASDVAAPYRGYSGLEITENRTFAWTIESEVEHLLPSRGSLTPHIFELQAVHALNPDFLEGVEFVVNGRSIPIWNSGPDWPRTYTAWIPPGNLKDRGLNLLTLFTPPPVSPSSLKQGSDWRTLGLQVDWLSLSSAEGFVRFLSPPPRDVLETLQSSGWVSRTLSLEEPDQPGWEHLEGDYWENSSSQPDVSHLSPLWLYRPGDFSADFARLPVGIGWSEPGADSAGRPTLFLEGPGHLALRLPQGKTALSFTVLKKEEDEPGPDIRLSFDGTPIELKHREDKWETVYQAELEGAGGVSEFLFQSAGGPRSAFGQMNLAPRNPAE